MGFRVPTQFTVPARSRIPRRCTCDLEAGGSKWSGHDKQRSEVKGQGFPSPKSPEKGLLNIAALLLGSNLPTQLCVIVHTSLIFSGTQFPDL